MLLSRHVLPTLSSAAAPARPARNWSRFAATCAANLDQFVGDGGALAGAADESLNWSRSVCRCAANLDQFAGDEGALSVAAAESLNWWRFGPTIDPNLDQFARSGEMTAVAGAFLAGVLAVLGGAAVLRGAWSLVRARAPRLARAVAGLAETVARAGREGRYPGALERRRLLVAGAAAAFAGGTLVAGPGRALAALAGPFAVARVLRSRRERYRHAVEDGAAEIAIALSDALAGGHSLARRGRRRFGERRRAARPRTPRSSMNSAAWPGWTRRMLDHPERQDRPRESARFRRADR